MKSKIFRYSYKNEVAFIHINKVPKIENLLIV